MPANGSRAILRPWGQMCSIRCKLRHCTHCSALNNHTAACNRSLITATSITSTNVAQPHTHVLYMVLPLMRDSGSQAAACNAARQSAPGGGCAYTNVHGSPLLELYKGIMQQSVAWQI